MGSREIITLQVGHYANYVGAHFWNAQELLFAYTDADARQVHVDNSVLFRPGVTLQGHDTFTPRLIAVDLKGSLGGLEVDSRLYRAGQTTQQEILWSGEQEIHQEPPHPKNEYLSDLEREEYAASANQQHAQNDARMQLDEDTNAQSNHSTDKPMRLYRLDESVKVWSDFLRVHLHPQTIALCKEYVHASESVPFNVFPVGVEAAKTPEMLEAFEERVHFFAEECDSLQGFHVLADTDSSFGGMASHFVELLEDDYSKKAVLTFGLGDSQQPDSANHSDKTVLNSHLCLHQLATASSAYVPLSLRANWRPDGNFAAFPSLNFQPGLAYHTSAILAGYIDTITLPYRSKTQGMPLSQLCGVLACGGTYMKAAGAALGLPIDPSWAGLAAAAQADALRTWSALVPITPTFRPQAAATSEAAVLRGGRPGSVPIFDLPAHLMPFPRTNGLAFTNNTGWCISEPYPDLSIRDDWTTILELGQKEKELCAVLGYAQASAGMADSLQSLASEVGKINIRHHHEYEVAGCGRDEWGEAREHVLAMVDAYLEH